jgi:hypothetical protein
MILVVIFLFAYILYSSPQCYDYTYLYDEKIEKSLSKAKELYKDLFNKLISIFKNFNLYKDK